MPPPRVWPDLLTPPPKPREPRWPAATIDFEASALTHGSYPIEVGFAIWRSAESFVESWSTLVRPTAEWLERGHWSPQSEAVHGIRQVELGVGMPARDAAEFVLRALAGMEACCDGFSRDQKWWAALLAETPLKGGFVLTSMEPLYAAGGDAVRRFLDTTKSGHRARGDAERLIHAYAHGLGLAPPVVDYDGGPTGPRPATTAGAIRS